MVAVGQLKQAKLHKIDVAALRAAPSRPWITHPSVSVVIPTLNEAKNLPYVLPLIPAWVHEIILVDGHSTDGTVEVARELCPSIRVVNQTGRGKGDALRAGFTAATGEIIVMIDADGSTDPREIPFFCAALSRGADFVKGSRFLQGGGTSDMELYRRFGNGVFTAMVKILFGGNFTDLCYGYNAFWRRVVPQLDLDADGFEIETMMNVRALSVGLKITEVPSFEFERVHGKSNLRTIPDGWRVLKTIFGEWVKARGRRHRVSAQPVSPYDEMAAHIAGILDFSADTAQNNEALLEETA